MNDTVTYNSDIEMLIEPEPIAYSFNTPGWYMLLGLLCIVALLLAILQYRKYRKNAYRREGIKEIDAIHQNKKKTAVFEINELLKKMAIRFFGRKKVAALYGLDWFNFLASTNTKTTSLSTKNFNEFTIALYDNTYQLSDTQIKELADFAASWVKNHSADV